MMYQTAAVRPTPWLAMILSTIFVTVVTLVIFGAFGGLFLIVGLNGFSESTGGLIILGYALIVLAGNFGVAALVNWLIARHRYAGTRGTGWAPWLVAIGVTVSAGVLGPPLAVLLMQLIFKVV